MSSPLRIVSVASEVAPYSKTGGLADVAKGLPKALSNLGHDVSIITPWYSFMKTQGLQTEPVNILTSIVVGKKKFAIETRRVPIRHNFYVYFIVIPSLFSNRGRIYGYEDDNLRFLVFNLAALKVIDLLGLKPHIIHSHDWQAGLIPNYLELRRKQYPSLKNTRTVFTIHNLAFQAGVDWWKIDKKHQDDGKGIPNIVPSKLRAINFTKRAIRHADIINTVSVRYAQEILTPEFGQGLERILQEREEHLYGIINGIDYTVYNPSFDQYIKHKYDWRSSDRKIKNKLLLQKEMGLEQKRDIPMIGVVNRFTEQKGFALIMETIDILLRQPLQIVVVGSGRKDYIQFFRHAARKHPKKIALITPFTEEMASKVYAGSDLFLMPSRYEPCGISQLISMRYGSIPIVHETGGLSDTITNYNPHTGKGTGFVFRAYNSGDFLIALGRALETFAHTKSWTHLVMQAMRESYSWELPAKKYLSLYRIAQKKKPTITPHS
ncbi:MAG: glycogen synthase [Patescibacteria group bacterium]|jgi:starch synthase